ncbi:MAG: alpha/beta fold hydrolase [Alphaproteobacteria bacterium]|nr:alpha/beta fold hydrolase [Alphaproteobacteria bacterium]
MANPITAAPADNAAAARAWLERLERAARRLETPCGDGTMVWRGWGQGPAVLLLHGGAGSWRHWARNLGALATDHTVLAPDLPGLGDSAQVPDPVGAEAIADLVFRGLKEVLDPDAQVHIAGFSFGGVIAGLVAAKAGDRVRSLTLIGTGGLGPPNRSVELVTVRHRTGDDRLAAHRENLLRMMLASPACVDALALEIQEQHSNLTRLNSGSMWISPVLHAALPRVHGRVHALWGEHEMDDQALLAARTGLLREARPDAAVAVIPGAGHWLFYEAADLFNEKFQQILAV